MRIYLYQYRNIGIIFYVSICSVVLMSLFTLHLYVQLLINYGQLQRIHQTPYLAATTLAEALRQLPKNDHLRWQVASVKDTLGQHFEALDILAALDSKATTHLDANRLLLDILVEVNQQKQAKDVFEKLPSNMLLQQKTASALSVFYLNQTGALPWDRLSVLLRPALGFTNIYPINTGEQEYDYLLELIKHPNFWVTPVGQRTQIALEWKATEGSNIQLNRKMIDLGTMISTQLDISKEKFSLGPELISNGNFERYNSFSSSPDDWKYILLSGTNFQAFNHQKTNRSAFVIGSDSSTVYSGSSSIRIDGLSIEKDTHLDPATAGMQHQSVELSPNVPYVISFAYHTHSTDTMNLQLWLSTDFGFSLPPAENGWNEFVLFVPQSEHSLSVQPWLRTWSEGSVWFDAFSIRSLEVDTPNFMLPKQPKIILVNASNSRHQ